MTLVLTRPTLWWDGEALVLLRSGNGLSPSAMSLLLRLRRVTRTLPPTPYSGDFMSDDTSHQLKLVTAPASEPVTLSQAKAFLRIEHTADDAVITAAITVARQSAEHYLRALLLPQTWDYSIANPSSVSLNLPIGPATSITGITLTTEAGVTGTMNAANYRLSVNGRAVLFTTAPQIEKLTVRFAASLYPTAADIPAPIVQGMLHHIVALVEERDGAVGLPIQSVNCYASYRRVSL